MHGRTACTVFEVESLSSVPRDVYRSASKSSAFYRAREPHALESRLVDMFSDARNARIDYYDTLNLDGLLAEERESPRDVDLLVTIGRRYLKQRTFDQAHAYYSKALAIDADDGWTHLYMGNLCYALACYDEAESHFKRAVDLLPGVACPQWCLGDVYDKQGYWSRTETQYRRAVETDPSDAKAKERLEGWLAGRHSGSHNTSTTERDRTMP